MNSRPKFWNNRSPRFWWGFWILIFLFVCWAWSCYFRVEVTHTSASGRQMEITVTKGRLSLNSWQWAGTPTLLPRWEFRSSKLIGFEGMPRFSRTDTPMGVYHRLFIPLWIPLAAWLILWRLWLRHAHKKAGANLFAPG